MRNSNTLIILGSAGCLWNDLKEYGPIDGDVLAINRVGYLYEGRIDHWATLHPEWIGTVKPLRKGNQDYITHANKEYPGAGIDRATGDWGGTSGLFACKVGLELGYSRIILCGVPMQDDQKYFYDQPMGYTLAPYRKGWERHIDELRGKVFSMSGWTKAILNPETKLFSHSYDDQKQI